MSYVDNDDDLISEQTELQEKFKQILHPSPHPDVVELINLLYDQIPEASQKIFLQMPNQQPEPATHQEINGTLQLPIVPLPKLSISTFRQWQLAVSDLAIVLDVQSALVPQPPIPRDQNRSREKVRRCAILRLGMLASIPPDVAYRVMPDMKNPIST